MDVSKSEVKSEGVIYVLSISCLDQDIIGGVALGVLEKSWAGANNDLAGKKSAWKLR